MGRFLYFNCNEIKPQGWMKRQLEIQANGLNGNLDKMWRDVRDSKYIGGDAEGWERVPYWLDGFIPLAYLLDNEDMKARAKKYIDAIIASQHESGWICPCDESSIPTYDTWAVQLISKVLTVYYNCSNDERIPKVLYKALKNYYDLLKSGEIVLFSWGKYRWFETFYALILLKNIYKEDWIIDLGNILKDQGFDFSLNTEVYKKPIFKWAWDTHIVNMGMMLKTEALCSELLGVEYTDKAEELYNILYKYNGTPVGMFTGDECLAGLSPIHGTELCGVVELMFSFETLYAITGDDKWLDKLEMVGYNGLPATISEDMWRHQYNQLSNQINCIKFPGKAIFATNGPEAHLFGLEPHFGCCTANFGQGYPKLAHSSFVYDEKEIRCSMLIPSIVDCDKASIKLETNYPFENKATFTINAKSDFDFSIRIPKDAKNVLVNGKEYENTYKCVKGNNYTFTLVFDTDIELLKRPYDLYYVKRGPLVYSLPIAYDKIEHEYVKDGVERKYPYCDYELVGKDKWNYAYISEDFSFEYKGVSDIPYSFSNPPVVIKCKMSEVEWDLEEGYETVCGRHAGNKLLNNEKEEKILIPYGCAKLRMTEMPFIK